MLDKINEIKGLQTKMQSLLLELHYAKEFERMKAQYGKFYLLKDGYLMTDEGKILADTPSRIKSYRNLRNINDDHVLDLTKTAN